MKRFILLLVTLFAMTNVMAQLQPDMPIPADKEVRVGRLENGMTYYIRHNEKPKGQACFERLMAGPTRQGHRARPRKGVWD